MPDDPALLPAPWRTPDGGMRAWEVELHRELAPGHALYGAQVAAAARCAGCDDVLFRVTDRPFPWAVVHLTWTGRRERAPWPMTTPLASLAELLAEWADHGCAGDWLPQPPGHAIEGRRRDDPSVVRSPKAPRRGQAGR